MTHLYSRASLEAQTVKRLPAMWETGFDSWVGETPWRRKWQSTPALLPGKSHGRRSLIGYSPWGHKELDTTEQLHYGGYVSMCVYTCVCLFDSLIWSTQYTRELRGNIFTLNWGVGDGQGGLPCCDSWGRKELDTTEWLNWTELSRSLTCVLKIQCECEVIQSCLTFCDPMDYSLSGSSVHGIFQARILEWVGKSFSRRSS